MLERAIPSTGEKIPVIGIGTWKQFDVNLNDPVTQDLSEILKLMKTRSAKLIDSSPMYGKSESVVGELTGKLDADYYFYATKVWTTGREEGIRQMGDSMRKMKRLVIDLMQVHNLVDVKTHLSTLRKWKEEGSIRYIGVTHYTVSAHKDLEEVLLSEALDFIQFNYSIKTRNAERTLLPLAKDKGVAVIINEPLEKGELFSKIHGKELPGWAADYGINNWSSFFLKYILANDAVTCVIPGTSNPKHMADLLSAGDGILPDANGMKKMVGYFQA